MDGAEVGRSLFVPLEDGDLLDFWEGDELTLGLKLCEGVQEIVGLLLG